MFIYVGWKRIPTWC